MSNLIDRQATLKHIEKVRQDALMIDDMRRAGIIMTGMDLLEEAVRNRLRIDSSIPSRSSVVSRKYNSFARQYTMIPSAQSEIIHCSNCIHHIDEKPGMVYCPEIIGGWVKNDCFCAIWEGKR